MSIPRFNLSLPVNPWLWSGAESCGPTWDEGRASYSEIETTAFVIPSAARNDVWDAVAEVGNKSEEEQGPDEVDRRGRCAVGR